MPTNLAWLRTIVEPDGSFKETTWSERQSAMTTATNPTNGTRLPRAAPVDRSWAGFEARLAAALRCLPVDQFLILSTQPATQDDPIYYVQFAQGGPSGLRAEAVSNAYLLPAGQLSPSQEAALASAGWQAPYARAERPENYNRQWPMPAPFTDVAALAVATLRDVFGVVRPANLRYRRFARRGRGDLTEPGLGIPAEAPGALGAAGRYGWGRHIDRRQLMRSRVSTTRGQWTGRR